MPCGVSESMGHFKVIFILGHLFFKQQATYPAGKGSATTVFQVFPPQHKLRADFVWLEAPVSREHNCVDFTAIFQGDRQVAES